jgi:hypothetical protein
VLSKLANKSGWYAGNPLIVWKRLIFKRIGLAFGDVRQHSCALGFTQDSRPGAFSAVPSGLVSVAKYTQD